MATHRHNGKPVVRSGNVKPTPYLCSIKPFLLKVNYFCRGSQLHNARAVDIGCGNGRNSRFLESLSYDVLSFDRKPDYGFQVELEDGKMPVLNETINVVLLQYVLMFLEPAVREAVVRKAFDICGFPGAIVVELATVKSSLCLKHEDNDAIQDWMTNMAVARNWIVYKPRRHHFVVTNFATNA